MEIFAESAAIAVTELSASNCHRAAGGMPPLGNYTLYYGATLSPLQLAGDLIVIETLWNGRAVIRVTSTTGDVVCAGEVSEPEPPVFADDFESEQS